MSNKIKLIPIEYPQFGDSFINYFIEPNREKALEFLKTKDCRATSLGSGLTICQNGRDPIVWLIDKKPHRVAHEMIHAVSHMFDNLNIRVIGGENHEIEEVFAYCVDYAIKQICK